MTNTDEMPKRTTDDDVPVVKRPSMRVVDPREKRPPCSDSAADRAFLDAHRAELAERYPDEFVAVANGTIAGHGPKLFPLGDHVREHTGLEGGLFWFTGSRRPEFSRDGEQVWP
jgi:hypothetical protein